MYSTTGQKNLGATQLGIILDKKNAIITSGSSLAQQEQQEHEELLCHIATITAQLPVVAHRTPTMSCGAKCKNWRPEPIRGYWERNLAAILTEASAVRSECLRYGVKMTEEGNKRVHPLRSARQIHGRVTDGVQAKFQLGEV